jgi:hypothetical protein
VTGAEAQLLFARTLLLVLLYGFLGMVAWLAWRELSSQGRGAARPAPVAAARVVVLQSGESGWPPGTSFTLEPLSVIGRDLDADVVLQDGTLSGRHALIGRDDGGWWVEDLGSTNGTFVNSSSVPPVSTAPLRSGDVLRCGNVQLRVVLPAAAPA